jgi:hypothetical protein
MEQAIAGLAHLGIGLDRKDAVPIFQEKPSECSRPGRNVRDVIGRLQRTLVAQKFNNLGRVSRTVADVVFYPVGESCGWSLSHCS